MLLKKICENKILFHLLVFLISFLIVVSRRPDALLNPQFWAEDGSKWYAQVYNDGFFNALLTPADGYFQTISRLGGGLAQFVPFIHAPLLFNAVAITCKILVVNLLISRRFDELIPGTALRFVIALLYLALPNSYEVHANLTNAQWHLAILSCLIILAKPGESMLWRIFDFAVVSVSVLSGPFCLFLLPVAIIQWLRTKDRWNLYLAGIVLGGVIVQVLALTVLTGFDRPSKQALGATPELFVKIIGGQIVLATLTGQNTYLRYYESSGWNLYTACLIALIGAVPVLNALRKGKAELKLYLLFAGLITAGALLSPALTKDKPQWQELWLPNAGNRYWLIPAFGLVLALITLAVQGANRYWRCFGALLLLILPYGIYKDWKFKPYKDLQFSEEARKLADAPTGSEVEIPINPDWTMKLKKK